MTTFKYIGYVFTDEDTCEPIFENSLKAVQRLLDIEINERYKNQDHIPNDLHAVVYEVKKEIPVGRSFSLSLMVDLEEEDGRDI